MKKISVKNKKGHYTTLFSNFIKYLWKNGVYSAHPSSDLVQSLQKQYNFTYEYGIASIAGFCFEAEEEALAFVLVFG
jgi:hypothetical protein